MAASRSNPTTHSTALVAARGVITHLFPAEDYGLLRTEDGRELRFRRAEADGEFDRLNLGTTVLFREELSESGPEATEVVRAT